MAVSLDDEIDRFYDTDPGFRASCVLQCVLGRWPAQHPLFDALATTLMINGNRQPNRQAWRTLVSGAAGYLGADHSFADQLHDICETGRGSSLLGLAD